jgi:AcrR family transcriptional regulator
MVATKKENSAPGAEEKIKEAARRIFHKKGYGATRTRDIAEEAGINLALLNYYFRSKEKLFEIIMTHDVHQFLNSIREVFNDKDSSIDEKIDALVNRYIDELTEHPDIPIFILSELRSNPEHLFDKMGLAGFLSGSTFLEQLTAAQKAGQISAIHPIHLVINLLSMTVFPFVAKPMLEYAGGVSNEQFAGLMESRKQLIPIWIKEMLKP